MAEVRDGDETIGGGGRIMRVGWMWGRGSMWRPQTHVSPNPPPEVLNVKCLTGRLSEEELQRAVAPLVLGGLGGGLTLSGWVFVSLPHAGVMLLYATAITGVIK